ESMQEYKKHFIKKAHEFNFPVHKPISELNKTQFDLLWNGNNKVSGIVDFFEYLESKSYKIQFRVMLARYRGKTLCPDCNGTRLRKDANNVKISGKCISELVLFPIDELKIFFEELKLDENDKAIAKRLLIEINSRLK
ncbi:MAG: excinuclease ABC subunit A, partial [Bacteroidota bacterium]